MNESDLDSPAHRALAREAAAKSYVLLENEAGLLPLSASTLPKKIAVVGAFSRCEVTYGDYGGHDSDNVNCSLYQCS